MNYRHGFHAGNHTEVFKHAALVLLIGLLQAKPKAIRVIDTHAGAGIHDLRSSMATRTLEADSGIRLAARNASPELRRYLDIVREVGGPGISIYPGSPEIVRRLLRDQDRLVACELHPEDAAQLRTNMRLDRRVAVHNRDGHEALLALIPPAERRGLVFIDPPYEEVAEVDRLGGSLVRALRKWAPGVFCAWFPIKDRAIEGALRRTMQGAGVEKAIMATFLGRPYDAETLAGGGLLVVNPPWTADDGLKALCRALVPSFDGASWKVEWIG